jgi:hypothetical protein
MEFSIVRNLFQNINCDFCSKKAVVFFIKQGFWGNVTVGYLCENHRIDYENNLLKI